MSEIEGSQANLENMFGKIWEIDPRLDWLGKYTIAAFNQEDQHLKLQRGEDPAHPSDIVEYRTWKLPNSNESVVIRRGDHFIGHGSFRQLDRQEVEYRAGNLDIEYRLDYKEGKTESATITFFQHLPQDQNSRLVLARATYNKQGTATFAMSMDNEVDRISGTRPPFTAEYDIEPEKKVVIKVEKSHPQAILPNGWDVPMEFGTPETVPAYHQTFTIDHKDKTFTIRKQPDKGGPTVALQVPDFVSLWEMYSIMQEGWDSNATLLEAFPAKIFVSPEPLKGITGQ